MPRKEKQKLKLMAVLDILRRQTDEKHPVGVPEILQLLQERNISAERKSIYDDVDTLREMGYDVQLRRGRRGGYYLAEGEFQLAELKLLVDAVQASKFITKAKSRELIKKLERFTSRYQEDELQRQVLVSGRYNKASDERIYYSVDALHRAIFEKRQITFTYREWNMEKRLVARHNGKLYCVSPWALVWENGNYYLIAYSEGKLKNYRVDKIAHVELLDADREGAEAYAQFDVNQYVQQMFDMFGGEEENVTLLCDKKLVGAIIDRFGTGPILIPCEDGEHFRVHVQVQVSPRFVGWVAGFDGGVQIAAPASVRRKMAACMHKNAAANEGEPTP